MVESRRTSRGTPLMTGSLEEKAMLVRLQLGQWTARRQSKIGTKKVQDEFKLASGQALVTKALVANNALATINSKLNYASSWFKSHTLPWTDDGYRILSSAGYTEFMSVMRAIKADVLAEIDKVSDNYEAIKAEAMLALNGPIESGGLYDEADYPSNIRDKYRFDVTIQPIPKRQDFRVTGISDEALEEIEKQIEERYKSAESNAMKEVYDRVYEVMTKVYEAFSNPEANFQDSKIDNVTELMEMLPKLNIAGDKNLDQMRKVIETKICTLNPRELRIDINARKTAADDARKILAQMDEYC